MSIIQKIIIISELYAASALRYGMSAVILWFSIQQFLHTSAWIGYIPDSVLAITHWSASSLVLCNATFEFILGILLVFGWQTRIIALLLALHLLDITWVVGYGEIGARDFGLFIATLVVCMNGSDILCITINKTNKYFHESISINQ
jgi:uncharacterized membrane protein YphA (DoxX/SURF4 family)